MMRREIEPRSSRPLANTLLTRFEIYVNIEETCYHFTTNNIAGKFMSIKQIDEWGCKRQKNSNKNTSLLCLYYPGKEKKSAIIFTAVYSEDNLSNEFSLLKGKDCWERQDVSNRLYLPSFVANCVSF